jgi:hypothetical protein
VEKTTLVAGRREAEGAGGGVGRDNEDDARSIATIVPHELERPRRRMRNRLRSRRSGAEN